MCPVSIPTQRNARLLASTSFQVVRVEDKLHLRGEKNVSNGVFNSIFRFLFSCLRRPEKKGHYGLDIEHDTFGSPSYFKSGDERSDEATVINIDCISVDSDKGCFHYFAQLPPELRLQIWRLSLPEREGREIGSAPSSTLTADHHPRNTCPLPRILWVNHESRKLAIKAQKYTIRDESLKSLFPHQIHRFEYIVDYELDTFVFRDLPRSLQYHSALQLYGSGGFFHSVKAELGGIRRLKIEALDPTPDWFSSQIEEHLGVLLPIFMSLQTLVFVLHLEIGDVGWAELNIDSARSIGCQYLSEYEARQLKAGNSWLPPTLDLHLREVA